MYDSSILQSLKKQQSAAKNIKVSSYQGSAFNSMKLNTTAAASTKPLSSWINIPLATIGKGLDYLASFNPLQAVEKVGGMVKEVMNVGNDMANIPGTFAKAFDLNKQEKSLNEKLNKGQISQEDYNNQMGAIKTSFANISQKYNLKTGMEAGLTVGDAAATLAPVGGLLKGVAKGVVKGAVKKGAAQEVKNLFTPAVKSAAEVASNEMKTGLLSKGFQAVKTVASAPAMKFAGNFNNKLMESAAISDVARKVTPDSQGKFAPVKIMPDGAARDAAIFGGQLFSPVPFVGKTFNALSKGKNFLGEAADYQAAESAFQNFFGDALNKVEVFKTPEARATAEKYFMGVMKEKGMMLDETSITKFLDDVYSPKVKDLPNIASSTKKVLQASGVEKIEDLKKMDDTMLQELLKNPDDVSKLKGSMEEIGKTDFTGMHFTTPEDQLKAMASFMYNGVHSGTWRGTADELKAEVSKNYDNILKGIKGETKVEGPMAQLKFPGSPVPVTKFKTSAELLEIIQKKTSGTIQAIEDARKVGIDNVGKNVIEKTGQDLELVKQMRRDLQKSSRGTSAFRAEERAAADSMIAELQTKYDDLVRTSGSVKTQMTEQLAREMETKTGEVFQSQFPKTQALTVAPEVVPKFVIKHEEPVLGAWTKKTADEQGFDTLYNQGVRELPKGDASFLEGRKADIGKAINQLKDSKIGSLLVPQNSKVIYEKISNSLDKNLIDVFGKDASRAAEAVKTKLQKPMISIMGKDVPIYKPTERELGIGAWKEVAAEITGKAKYSDEVGAMAKQLDKGARQAFVTSMKEAGVGTNVVDKLRANSAFYNSMYYYYTLGRFNLRAMYHFQQVPEVYMWGTVRADKLATGSLIKTAAEKQVALKRTIGDFTKPTLTKGQESVMTNALGYTEDIASTSWRQFPFAVKNEANAYGQAMVINADKALNSMPVVKEYLAKNGLKSAEEIPYLREMFYSPLADDADNMANVINKYGFDGAKAHLADETKNTLENGREAAVFDNAIREAMKISKATAYQEAMPLFLYNPNRSTLEKSLHSSIMFPLSYVIKATTRGGEYLLDGNAIRPQIMSSVISAIDSFNNSEFGKNFSKKYYNLLDMAESWSPINPNYPYSTGFLPPFSKMVYRWMEKPDFYLDPEKGAERSLSVMIPAYREMKGWQDLVKNITKVQDDVRANISSSTDPAQADKIIKDFMEGKTISVPRIQNLPDRAPKATGGIKDNRTASEKAFDEKKALRGSLTDTAPVPAPTPVTPTTKYVPKLTIPNRVTPAPATVRAPYYNKS